MATRRRRQPVTRPPRKGLQIAVILVLVFMLLGIILPAVGLSLAGLAQ